MISRFEMLAIHYWLFISRESGESAPWCLIRFWSVSSNVRASHCGILWVMDVWRVRMEGWSVGTSKGSFYSSQNPYNTFSAYFFGNSGEKSNYTVLWDTNDNLRRFMRRYKTITFPTAIKRFDFQKISSLISWLNTGQRETEAVTTRHFSICHFVCRRSLWCFNNKPET